MRTSQRSKMTDKLLREIQSRFYSKCIAILRTMGATREEADAIWVYTFEEFWEKPPAEISSFERLEHWFIESTKHDFLDLRRKQGREQAHLISTDEVCIVEADDENVEVGENFLFKNDPAHYSRQDAEYDVLLQDTLNEINECLGVEEMAILSAKGDEHFTFKHIATFFGKSPTAARKQAQRAREKLAKRGIDVPRRRW